MAMVLVVEDEKLFRMSLTEQLERAGHSVLAAPTIAATIKYIQEYRPDILLLDLDLPDGHGLDFYEEYRTHLDGTVVVIMSGVGEVEDAVRAMKLGVLDYLIKPIDQHELLRLIDRSLNLLSDQTEAQVARHVRDRSLRMDLVAESPAFRAAVEMAEKVARSEINTVLLQGQSGSGKNVLARHIHALSSRRNKPLLEVSCPTIAENLLESELFGHEKGSFTDAHTTRQGVFELADGGTVVLDEIGELKGDLQAKLLDVLEERRLRRVGSTREIHIDVRVIALTNRNLADMEREGRFRRDLHYRLNVFPITLPPLQERTEDILPLARYFIRSMENKFGRHFEGLSRTAENRLISYPWPGNVRELRNVIERAMLLEPGPVLHADSLMLFDTGHSSERYRDAGTELPAGITPLARIEEQMVARAMNASGNNQSRAAALLGISRDQLRYRLKRTATDRHESKSQNSDSRP